MRRPIEQFRAFDSLAARTPGAIVMKLTISGGVMATLAFASAAICAPIATMQERRTHPELGAESSREVGEAMFESSIVTTMPGAIIAPGVRMSLGLGGAVTYRGSELYAKQRGKKITYCGAAEISNITGQVIPFEFCETEEWLTKKGVTLTPTRVTKVSPENFRQELLYQGKAGSTLKLSYREFSSDMARPAFTQDLTFDLAEGAVIGAKGARVEVFEATNTSIRYRLLQPFSPR